MTLRKDKSPIVALPPRAKGGVDLDPSTPIMLSFVDMRSPGPSTRPSPKPRKKFSPSFPAVAPVLPNTGSVARDHLASERTWLSYVRTSLGVASTGVALVQLFTMSANKNTAESSPDSKILQLVHPLGIATVSLGLYVLAIGVRRYFCVQNALIEGSFPIARVTVIVITSMLAILVLVIFGVLVTFPRR